MAQQLKANDETWEVRLSREEAHDGITSVIFHCVSNSSYGWRVVEVAAGKYGSQEGVDQLPDDELHRLFDRSQPFDYTHDHKARPGSIGDQPGI